MPRGRGGTADALASGASGGNLVVVQIHSTAPKAPVALTTILLCGSGGTADAPAWGAGGGNLVVVQIHSTAPLNQYN